MGAKTKSSLAADPAGHHVEHLAGHQVSNDQNINEAIQKIVQEIGKHGQSITGPRSADEERASSFQGFMEEVTVLRGRPLSYPYMGTGAGRGPYVELEDGSVKLDLLNGIGINILGHSHPRIIEASLRGAMSNIVVQGNIQPNREYIELLKKLTSIASKNSRLKQGWLTTSGSMANENALKIVRQKHSPARKVVAMKAAFAGRTTLMAEITDNAALKVGLPPYDEILRVPFYDKNNPSSTAEATRVLKDHIEQNKGDISAFMFEPLQGEGGYNVAPREYFLPLFELCKANKIAIWADEVQTFARSGEFFAFEKLGLGEYIDVCTVAKSLQLGATLYTEEYNPQPNLVAGTFAGTSSAFCAGMAVLDELSQGYMGDDGKIQKIHEGFIQMLTELSKTTCKGLLREPDGMGLMVAVIPLDGSLEKVKELLKVLYDNGLIAFKCGRGPYKLRFLLPAVLTEKDIQVARGIIEKSILELA